MRPQQQNRRMRGRGNNNNRRGPNPLTRSYESNGPDVKIRGTAQQVADKYTTLARDAQSSGDRVIAENYLQHAEHYNRLIAAAQAQTQPQQQMRDRNDEDDLDDRDEQEAAAPPSQQQVSVNDGSGPQPVIEGLPAEVALKDRQASGGNGAKPNGRGNGEANGQAEKPQEPSAEATAKETAEDMPKPAKRTRRPRTRKSDPAPAGDATEAPQPESATTQG